jgi:hypothetical protein
MHSDQRGAEFVGGIAQLLVLIPELPSLLVQIRISIERRVAELIGCFPEHPFTQDQLLGDLLDCPVKSVSSFILDLHVGQSRGGKDPRVEDGEDIADSQCWASGCCGRTSCNERVDGRDAGRTSAAVAGPGGTRPQCLHQ